MRIGIEALSEDEGSGTGGLTYLRGLLNTLPTISPDDEFVVFCRSTDSPLMSSVATNRNVRLYSCGFANRGVVPRVIAQQVIVALAASRLRLDVLLCPGNVVPILARTPTVLIIQNALLFKSTSSKEYQEQPVGIVRATYRRVAAKASVARASAVIAVSSHLGQVVRNEGGVSSSKVRIIGIGVDPGLTSSSRAAERRPKSGYVLNVGRMLPGKNQDKIIRAFATYVRRSGDSNRELWIVGNDFGGQSDVLRRVASQEGISDRVVLRNFVPYADMPSIYMGAALCVQLSYTEAFCLPVLEAMAFGVPMIGSRTSVLPEVGGDAAILVEPDSGDAVADAIYRVLQDDMLSDELSERGRKQSTLFSWVTSATRLMDALRETMKASSLSADVASQ